jgi:hypothetical protein
MLEAASADPDDADNAMDLQDAACAIDYAISILAPFAVAEETEAAVGTMDAVDAVGKAITAIDPDSLDTIQALTAVTKAGRVLSSANETAIRHAVDSLQKVLASLPSAPVEKTSGPEVAKTANEEPNMPTPTPSSDATEASGQEPALGAQQPEPVGKADGEKPEAVAVYDKNGDLVGIVDPSDITRIAGAGSDDDSESDGTDDSSADADPGTPDLTPAPAAEVGTPADAVPDDADVTKSIEQTDTDDVLKSSLLAAVETVLTKHSATQADQIAKTSDAVLELAELVETLKGRIGVLEEQPAEPRVFTNGAVPPREQLRGQDRGAAPVDVTKAAALKQTLYRGTATEQNKAAADMQTAAIAALQAIHQRR